MSFYHRDEDWVRKRITGAQGWAYLAYATEAGGNVVRQSDGYVLQESRRWMQS